MRYNYINKDFKLDAQQHRIIVSRFIKNKIAEYEYFLFKVIGQCDSASDRFRRGLNPDDGTDSTINYHFNALVNAYQSIKDSLETVFGISLPWSTFADVPHAKFFKECRNASTHDGMQMINCYVDGKFLIAGPIQRIDANRKVVQIIPPQEDLRTFCLEFTVGLMQKIETLLNEYGHRIPEGDTMFRLSEYEFALSSPHIPEFAKDMLRSNKEETLRVLSGVERNVVSELIDKVRLLKGGLEVML